MDLSKLSDADLEAVAAGDMSKVSDSGLAILSGGAAQESKPEESSAWDTAKEIGGRVLDVGLKTLDLPGGVVRTLVQGATDIPYYLRTGETVTKPEDYINMLKGEAPTSEEFMARQGIEPGMDRTAVGIAKDIALDPMTYMTLGASGLAKGTANAGKKLYKSGLKAIDLEAAKYGKEPVSELLMSKGITGSAESIQKQMDDLAKAYKTQRDQVLRAADKAGGRVSMADAMKPLQDKISEIRLSKDPNLQAVADTMEQDLAKYIELDPTNITPSQGSGFKSSTYNQMPDSAYALASRTPIGKALNKEKARGLKEAVEAAVEKSSGKYSADELRELNDKLGRLLTTEKKAASEAAKEINKNAVTQVDAMALAVDPKAYVAKQAIKALNMTGPRTAIGKKMIDNASGLGQLQKNLLYTPWVGMKRYQQNEDNQ